MKAKKEFVSKTDGTEAQEEQTQWREEAVAVTNEEIEMEQKERGDVTMEATEESTETDVDEYYLEDPSNIGIVALFCTYTGCKVLATSSLPKVPGRSAIPVAQFPDYVRQLQQERDNALMEEYKVL